MCPKLISAEIEGGIWHTPPSITAEISFGHITRVNRELGTLRSNYTTVRQVLCFFATRFG